MQRAPSVVRLPCHSIHSLAQNAAMTPSPNASGTHRSGTSYYSNASAGGPQSGTRLEHATRCHYHRQQASRSSQPGNRGRPARHRAARNGDGANRFAPCGCRGRCALADFLLLGVHAAVTPASNLREFFIHNPRAHSRTFHQPSSRDSI
jgi:hypothetical protein